MSSNLNPFSVIPSGNGSAFGMPISGGYGQGTTLLACTAVRSFAGAGVELPTTMRHADVATKHNPGTHVWSPPT